MEEADIIQKIKDFAIEVYNTLNEGYNEVVYHEALSLELRKAKIPFEIEYNTEIIYKNEKVGTQKLDFIIENKVIIELKTSAITSGHKAQLGAYLRTLGLKKGLIIRFPVPKADEPTFEEIDSE